ncbi:MAG: hypothetical protein M1594_00310 [Candidatus Marsarchaeota archaeon]|nr:hypothetical protein [Candidatus Marsarchaeota archaeon]
MFEKNSEKEEKQQLEITKKIVEKIKSDPNLTKEKVQTLERIARTNPLVREEIYEFLKKPIVRNNALEDQFPIEKEEKPLDKISEEDYEKIKSGLDDKKNDFYKTPEEEQVEKIKNMIENTLKIENENPKIGMINLLRRVSKNTRHESVKKTIIEGFKNIALENTNRDSGDTAAQAYEELVKDEKNGKELKRLSELRREVMKHPSQISHLTRELEEITQNKIIEIGKIGVKEKFRNEAKEYLENIRSNHSNYLVNRWANEELIKMLKNK